VSGSIIMMRGAILQGSAQNSDSFLPFRVVPIDKSSRDVYCCLDNFGVWHYLLHSVWICDDRGTCLPKGARHDDLPFQFFLFHRGDRRVGRFSANCGFDNGLGMAHPFGTAPPPVNFPAHFRFISNSAPVSRQQLR
jgi:hypothetical protein